MNNQSLIKPEFLEIMNDHADKALFVAIAVVGSFVNLFVKVYLGDALLIILTPVAFLLLYAGLSWQTKTFRLREDRIGDNLYYLGFIFTLVSLAYALYAYAKSNQGVEEIIAAFSIALVSTIAGVILRVLFNQMREDSAEYEAEAREDLAQAARRVKQELDVVVREFSSFKTEYSQVLKEAMSEVSRKASEGLDENVKKFTEVGAEVLTKIDATFKTFSEHSEKLSQASGQTVDALELLYKRIEQIKADPDVLSAKLDPLISSLRDYVDEQTKRSKQQNLEIKRAREVVDALGQLTDRLRDVLGETEGVVEQRVKQAAQSMSEVVQTLETYRASQKKLADDMLQVQQRFEEKLQSAADIAKTQGDLSAQVIQTMRETIEREVATLVSQRKELEEQVAMSKSLVGDTLSAMTGLAVSITERLDAKP